MLTFTNIIESYKFKNLKAKIDLVKKNIKKFKSLTFKDKFCTL